MPDLWYRRLFPSPLKRAFAALAVAERGPPDEERAYPYYESALVRFEGADLDEDVNPKTQKSREGFTGCAEFSHVQDPTTPGVMPFAVNHAGRKLTGRFLVEYDTLLIRAQKLRENGICPSETEKAIKNLDAELAAMRREAGLGVVLGFPNHGREP